MSNIFDNLAVSADSDDIIQLLIIINKINFIYKKYD